MIDVEDLCFTYDNATQQAVNSLTFSVEKGEIFGFLGPSGSGKSTTQKILCGLLPDYSGKARLLNKEVHQWGTDLYKHIGVGFELPNHYEKLSAYENLALFAAMYEDAAPIDPLLDEVGLLEDKDKKVESFSKGMKMRLNFCRALLGKPDILFLDEPTSGLDPVSSDALKQKMKALQADGTTIFLTTHNMQDADDLCNRVGFITDGTLRQLDSPYEMKQRYGTHRLAVEYETGNGRQVDYVPMENLGENTTFIDLLKQYEIKTMHSQEASLDQVFIEVTGRKLL